MFDDYNIQFDDVEDETYGVFNPNLYITLTSSASSFLWSSSTLPWQLDLPWQFP